jgi:hypothetical protein
MARQRRGRPLRRSILPTAIAGAGGAGAGYLAGRTAVSATAKAMGTMAEALVRQTTLSTTGPMLASGIMGGAIILAAVLIPLTVVWSIHREERTHAEEEETNT